MLPKLCFYTLKGLQWAANSYAFSKEKLKKRMKKGAFGA